MGSFSKTVDASSKKLGSKKNVNYGLKVVTEAEQISPKGLVTSHRPCGVPVWSVLSGWPRSCPHVSSCFSRTFRSTSSPSLCPHSSSLCS